VAVRHSARTCGATALAVTLLDVLAGFDTLQVCVRYDLGGRQLPGFPAQADDLAAVTPVYETMPGFGEEIGFVGRYGELPRAARGYLDFIADVVGVPVEIVSVGPAREQTLRPGELNRAQVRG
jgi:adenylosuccinate synthase